MSPPVTIVEVGPRDGLQNEKTPIPAADKIRLIDALSGCGFERIEAASFVSPKWVPQMGDAAEVMAGIARAPGVRYAALTPNLKGLEGALAAGVDDVAVFAAASETFSRRNINAGIDESLVRLGEVAAAARAAGVPVRGYVSCVVHCPYEGEVAPRAVAEVAAKLLALGCFEVSLGDTTGQGTPESVGAMFDALLPNAAPRALAGHFHDTNGRALESVDTALDRGITVFDAAIGGLGGCPYAPGAKGNLATERLVDHLERRGLEHGIGRGRLSAARDVAADLVPRLRGEAA